MTDYVICVSNAGYEASLELRKLYRALSDPEAARHDRRRIVDESGDDYLYPAAYFVDVDLPASVRERIDSAA